MRSQNASHRTPPFDWFAFAEVASNCYIRFFYLLSANKSTEHNDVFMRGEFMVAKFHYRVRVLCAWMLSVNEGTFVLGISWWIHFCDQLEQPPSINEIETQHFWRRHRSYPLIIRVYFTFIFVSSIWTRAEQCSEPICVTNVMNLLLILFTTNAKFNCCKSCMNRGLVSVRFALLTTIYTVISVFCAAFYEYFMFRTITNSIEWMNQNWKIKILIEIVQKN